MKIIINKYKLFSPFSFLLSLKTTLLCLILLFFLVVYGTLYQFHYGLYEAKARFFDSWIIIFKGYIPFPGVRSVLTILFFNLLVIFICTIDYSWKKIGIILIHLGIIILLTGAASTSYTSEESYISLQKDSTVNKSISYTEWEIVVYSDSSIETFDCKKIKDGDNYNVKRFPVVFTVKKYYQNAEVISVPLHNKKEESYICDSLVKKELFYNPVKNIPGIMLSVKNNSVPKDSCQKIILYGTMSRPVSLLYNYNNDTLFFLLRNKRFTIPFSLTLIDFTKKDYSGTSIARDYISTLHCKGNEIDRDIVISMNRPFRYKNLSFYQTAYSQTATGTTSSFAVVESHGKSMTYIASLFIVIGLCIHFCIKLAVYSRNNQKRSAS